MSMVVLLTLCVIGDVIVHITTCGGCLESERRALLAIKSGIYQPPEPDNKQWLSSWASGDRDCCSWRGVVCYNVTGHVTKLDLRNPYGTPATLGSSKLNSSLLDLAHLDYLDLSMNNFGGMPIPEFIGSFPKLEYLNLSSARFSGVIPPQIGNISVLRFLDLSSPYNYNFFLFDNAFLSVDKNSHWLSGISSLQYLDLSGVDLSAVSGHLFDDLNVLPSLSVLKLSSARLESIPVGMAHVNFTSLAVLDLSANRFRMGKTPNWVFNISSLAYLYLSHCGFVDMKSLEMSIASLHNLRSLDLGSGRISGQIPNNLGNLNKLELLDLSYNQLNGSVPETIGNLSNLQVLVMSNNNISGAIPETLRKLINLKYVDMSNNIIGGKIPAADFGRLCKLNHLDLSKNRIHGDITALIDGLFRCSQMNTGLEILALDSNNLNGTIPESLGQLSSLIVLKLSFNSFKGNLTESHFSNLSNLITLHLSYNDFEVVFGQDWIPPFNALAIEMCSCQLGPRFPTWLQTQKKLRYLCISQAGISDSFPSWLWDLKMWGLNASYNQIRGHLPLSLQGSMLYIDLSYNKFDGNVPLRIVNGYSSQFFSLSHNGLSGSLPSYFCNFTDLEVLDLSNNNFSGKLPSCQNRHSKLQVLDLSNNNLSGHIPCAIRSFKSLKSLHLRNNRLTGKIPSYLKLCKDLVILDLGENKLSGSIPEWIGENLLLLKVLRLRSNFFYGTIPVRLSNLTSLQVLDLAHNRLSSTLTPSLGSLKAMIDIKKVNRPMYTDQIGFIYYSYYEESLLITTKGLNLEYTQILSLVVCIDLSSNNLYGDIPEEITQLSGLVFLNLSRNHFTGKIPKNIGDMAQLQSLDLSINSLSGTIPSSMSSLYFLSSLKLYANTLSGRIPVGGQLQTFDTASYAGNLALCGPPLLQCPGNERDQEKEVDDKFGLVWLSYSIVLGFIMGHWGLMGTLIIKMSLRIWYFNFIDKICDWIYAELAAKFSRLAKSTIMNDNHQGRR